MKRMKNMTSFFFSKKKKVKLMCHVLVRLFFSFFINFDHFETFSDLF